MKPFQTNLNQSRQAHQYPLWIYIYNNTTLTEMTIIVLICNKEIDRVDYLLGRDKCFHKYARVPVDFMSFFTFRRMPFKIDHSEVELGRFQHGYLSPLSERMDLGQPDYYCRLLLNTFTLNVIYSSIFYDKTCCSHKI